MQTTNSKTISGPGLDTPARSERERSPVDALCIAWSQEEPWHIGEVALLEDPGRTYLFGRGPTLPDDKFRRLSLYRQRPARNEVIPPLESKLISRQQLVIEPVSGGLRVSCVGRCPLLVDGVTVGEAVIHPGQLFRIGQQLLLYYIRRPLVLPPLKDYPSERIGRFGEPDRVDVVGESPALWHLRDQLAQFGRSSKHVLIDGPSGSGKELAARAIHAFSDRSQRPIVSRSAATIPNGLVDAELFGNVRGYPNVGMPDRPGLVGEAHKSTLFLDEIGELATEAQAHLLRVLDPSGEYHRLGDAETRKSNIRFIGATNRDPRELKHDLRARFVLTATTLRLQDRREDIPLLARHLLHQIAKDDPALAERFFTPGQPLPTPRVNLELIEQLVRHEYTHHIRELEQLLHLSIGESDGRWLMPLDAKDLKQVGYESREDDEVSHGGRPIASYTEEEVRAALERNRWSKEKTWRDLGLKTRFKLHRLITKFGIKRP